MNTLQEHWNKIFKETPEEKLGWYESEVTQTIRFLDGVNFENKLVFLPGAGTSRLIDGLIENGAILILNDISNEALTALRKRVGNPDKHLWYCGDISKPLPKEIPAVDIWIDRAVLHFLIEDKEINGYFENLNRIVKTNGYVLLAEFSLNGAQKCAGLNVHRYSADELIERVGCNFKLLKSEEYVYVNPSGGERPYIYTLFKRNGA
ncbi:MAG: methyltransferase domain-containing protein [Melioribacter sp.]|uniref:methyltransferase domain-containing protein n=1 Tax=Melioribacter sp. TaxID=2052167 RepID=UPI003BCFE050